VFAPRYYAEREIIAQAAQGVVKIPPGGFEQWDAAPVAIHFLSRLNAAQFDQRLPASFRGRHAAPDIIFDMQLQVAAHLVG